VFGVAVGKANDFANTGAIESGRDRHYVHVDRAMG
jgi:hypothetical protein